jgi:hypothetical protein
MVAVEKVRELNTRIEGINKERTKAEARLEMLKKQLDEGINTYKEKYGVNLKGKDFSETKAKIKKEVEVITSSIEEEYEIKTQVVNCIEEGDYEMAYKYLGIPNPNVRGAGEESSKSPVSSGNEVDESGESDDDFGFGFEEDDMEVEEDDEVVEVPVKPQSKTSVNVKKTGNVTKPVKAGESKPVANEGAAAFRSAVKGQSVVSAVAEMDDMELDEDSIPSFEDDDFGFGEILKGSAFETE